MSTPSSPRKIFGFKDNLFPAPADEEDSKQLLPKKPRSAFICFTDAKKKELLERDGLPQKKNEILNLVAVEWRKLSDRERAFWDEEARKDHHRFAREKKQFKGKWPVPKRRAKKHPGAPKRPMSAFLSYSKSRRAKVKKDNPNMENTDISRLLGEMWRNASQAERAPYVEQEAKQRAAYNERTKEWREKQAKADSATRTSHHVVQQIQQPAYHGIGSFDPFVRVHSVEEAVKEADRSFVAFHQDDYSQDLMPRHAHSYVAKPGPFAGYRSHENEHPSYRPRRVLPTTATRGSYPFRPYPAGPTSSQPAYAPPPPKSPGDREEACDQYPTTSRYFDRPRHSPLGFYQYP